MTDLFDRSRLIKPLCILTALSFVMGLAACGSSGETEISSDTSASTAASSEASRASMTDTLATALDRYALEYGDVESCKDLSDLKERNGGGLSENKCSCYASGGEAQELFYDWFMHEKTTKNDVTEAVAVFYRNPGCKDPEVFLTSPYDLPVSNILLVTFDSEERAQNIYSSLVSKRNFSNPSDFVREEDHALSYVYQHEPYHDEVNDDVLYVQRVNEMGFYLSGKTVIYMYFERVPEKVNEFEEYICGKMGLEAPSVLTAKGDHSSTINKNHTPYEEVVLDGVADHSYVAEDYCYLESDKYVLFLEKGIKLPGDFKTNLDAIVDEIETQLRISSSPEDPAEYQKIGTIRIYDAPDDNGIAPHPWKGWDIGTKLPIFLLVDKEGEGYISGAYTDYVSFYIWSLYSNEIWDTVPYFKERSEFRDECVDYVTLAHEITHIITLRNNNLTDILSEGIADYTEEAVIFSLADRYPSIKTSKEDHNWDDNPVPKAVNADNAEKIFIEDYHDLSSAHRGAEYAYGSNLFKYLHEKYGDGFYSKFNDRIRADKLTVNTSEYDKASVKKFADVIKDLYGMDVFKKFGKWCVKNHVLQNVGYISG